MSVSKCTCIKMLVDVHTMSLLKIPVFVWNQAHILYLPGSNLFTLNIYSEVLCMELR